MGVLVIGLVLFLGAHVFVTLRGPRAAVIARIGEWPYKGLMSVVALVGLVLIGYGFGHYRATGWVQVWSPPRWTNYVTQLLMWPASICVVAAYCRGQIWRTLKHPMLVGVKTWAVAQQRIEAAKDTLYAGVDLLRLLDGGPDYIRQFLPALSTMLAAVFTHPKPVVAAINGHAMAGGCVLACAADRRIMARDAGRIGVTELLVGVPFPAAAMEIMRRATAPQYFEDAILSGATYNPPEAVARGLVHDIVDPHELLDRAIDAANTLAALSPPAFAITKRQTRGPAVERLQRADVDADIDRIWTAPDTLVRIRDYVSRTLRKS